MGVGLNGIAIKNSPLAISMGEREGVAGILSNQEVP
jgi:hypothetical protein